jgi:hypothetical protein
MYSHYLHLSRSFSYRQEAHTSEEDAKRAILNIFGSPEAAGASMIHRQSFKVQYHYYCSCSCLKAYCCGH